jgi:hypothetical protein
VQFGTDLDELRLDTVVTMFLAGAPRARHQGGRLMLRTIFMVAIFVWIATLGLQFGTAVLPLLLVVTGIVLAMDHMFHRRSLA